MPNPIPFKTTNPPVPSLANLDLFPPLGFLYQKSNQYFRSQRIFIDGNIQGRIRKKYFSAVQVALGGDYKPMERVFSAVISRTRRLSAGR